MQDFQRDLLVMSLVCWHKDCCDPWYRLELRIHISTPDELNANGEIDREEFQTRLADLREIAI